MTDVRLCVVQTPAQPLQHRCQLNLVTGALTHDSAALGTGATVHWQPDLVAPPTSVSVAGSVRMLCTQAPSAGVPPSLHHLHVTDGAQFVLLEPPPGAAPWHIGELHVRLARGAGAWLGGMHIGVLHLNVCEESQLHNVQASDVRVTSLHRSSFVHMASASSPARIDDHSSACSSPRSDTSSTGGDTSLSPWTEQDDRDFGMHIESLVPLQKHWLPQQQQRRRASSGGLASCPLPLSSLSGHARMLEPGDCLMCLLPRASVVANPCGCYTLCAECARTHGSTAAQRWQHCPYCKRKLDTLSLRPAYAYAAAAAAALV